MDKIYKILGKRGRITIPWEIRRDMGFACNDVVSFERDGDRVTVRREKLCDGCNGKNAAIAKQAAPQEHSVTLLELLDSLTPAELRAALIHLSVRWAEMTVSKDEGNGT